MPFDLLEFVKPEILYKPKNNLTLRCKENNVSNVSGNISSFSGGVYGGVQTTIKTVSFEVSVHYDGPIDIGERVIKSQTIEDLWANLAIIQRAKKESGGDAVWTWNCGRCCCACLACVSMICIPCFCKYMYDTAEEERNNFYKKKNEIIRPMIASQIEKILRESDELVTQRIAIKQAEASNFENLPRGVIQLDVAQFNELLLRAQQIPTNMPVNMQAVLPQPPVIPLSGSSSIPVVSAAPLTYLFQGQSSIQSQSSAAASTMVPVRNKDLSQHQVQIQPMSAQALAAFPPNFPQAGAKPLMTLPHMAR